MKITNNNVKLGKCPDCGLDYDIASNVIVLNSFEGVCDACGASIFLPELIGRWINDINNDGSIIHVFNTLFYKCPHCDTVKITTRAFCIPREPLNVTSEFSIFRKGSL